MSKPDVLFLHGAGGGGWEWNVWQRVFQAHGFQVHAPDLLPSASGLADTQLEDYSQQVQRHLLSMKSPKIIIGASLGGLLASMNADQADALVLINPLPPAPWHLRLPARENYPDVIPWRSDASLEGTRRTLFDGDEPTCIFAFRQWRDESGAVLNAAIHGIDVGKTSCPVLVMASENDSDIEFCLTKEVAESLNATFINLPKTSHVGPLLGMNASQIALQAVAYLNKNFPRY
ncbi:MAG: alpha/beta hydrolase [Arenimonas sp.]